MARSVTAFASTHQRTRCHVTSFGRGDVFTLGANFNACLNGATVASVVWRVSNPQALVLGSGAISGGLCTITATAGTGQCWVKALATLSDGNKVSQLYRVSVQSQPWFDGEALASAGSASVTVTA